MLKHFVIPVLLGMPILATVAGEPVELGPSSYAKGIPTRGVVIFEVNWGRKWGCAGIDNAQLLRLKFLKLPLGANAESLDLSTPARLLVNNRYQPFAFVLDPGTYAIAGFDVLTAKSKWNVGHVIGDQAVLFDGDEPKGGTFEVLPNEAVYLGHFALDCTRDAIPWRYYLTNRAAFDRFVAGFHKQFPYTANLPVRYRLFSTKMFGQDFELPDSAVASQSP